MQVVQLCFDELENIPALTKELDNQKALFKDQLETAEKQHDFVVGSLESDKISLGNVPAVIKRVQTLGVATDKCKKLLAEAKLLCDLRSKWQENDWHGLQACVDQAQGMRLSYIAEEVRFATDECYDQKLQLEIIAVLTSDQLEGEPGAVKTNKVSIQKLQKLTSKKVDADKRSEQTEDLLNSAKALAQVCVRYHVLCQFVCRSQLLRCMFPRYESGQ